MINWGFLMKESDDTEHRISNLKHMIDSVNEEDEEVNDDYEIEEDSELIDYLNEDKNNFDDLEIDDEYIYHPGDEDSYNINAEENPIDEEFIIKTPKIDDTEESNENDEFTDNLAMEIGDNFDTVVNAKIGKTPLIAIVSSVFGIILIIASLFIFQSRADRLVDNVVSGETNFIFIMVLIVGVLFLIYGLFKIFNLKNPFSNIMDSIEKDMENTPEKEEEKEKPSENTLPKSEIPLDKDSYKIGEFKMEKLTDSLTTTAPDFEELGEIPLSEPSQKNKNKKTEKESEKESKKEEVDTESIDEIFAEVDDIDKNK